MKLSLLQVKILLELRGGAVSNLAQLARTVGAKRPSVSRSMATLRRHGLTKQVKGLWQLTRIGRREIKMLDKRTLRSVEDAARVASRATQEFDAVFNQINSLPPPEHLGIALKALSDAAASPLNEMVRSMSAEIGAISSFKSMTDALAGIVPSNAMADIASSILASPGADIAGIAGLQASVGDSLVDTFTLKTPDFTELLSAALPPLIDSQHLQASMLSAMPMSEVVAKSRELFAENNRLVASAIESLELMSVTGLAKGGVLDALADVDLGLGQIASNYSGVIASGLSDLSSIPSTALASGVWRDVSVPTIAVSGYVSSIGLAVRDDDESDASAHVPSPHTLVRIDSEIDALLVSIRPEFLDMRRGSSQALASDNPDRLRHAAVSRRELLRMVLEVVAPHVEETTGEAGSKMKMRVRAVVESKTSAEFASSLAEAIYRYYKFLSKPTHTSYCNQQAVEAAFLAGDALLLFILAHLEE